MRAPAQHFLKLRSFGAPAVVLSLAVMGILRGFKDTRTSILCLGKLFFLVELYLQANAA